MVSLGANMCYRVISIMKIFTVIKRKLSRRVLKRQKSIHFTETKQKETGNIRESRRHRDTLAILVHLKNGTTHPCKDNDVSRGGPEKLRKN